jgi:hypothetical protein
LFVAHEWITQWRSLRFRALAGVYAIVASIPGVAAFLISGRTPRAIGPAAYNTFLLSEQPLLTALLAAGLAIDALSRERDEGSFSVLSVAPISSSGYVLRRWLAIVMICIPVSLLPTIVTAALAIHTRAALPLLPMFFEGWLLSVLPSLLVSSALALALGTITGRAVLSIIFTALLFTIGLDELNDVLFRVHRLNFDGPRALFAGGDRGIQELIWTIRGFWLPNMPSDAAFPLREQARVLVSRAGITAAMTIVLLSICAFYLRRTRRDLRPWNIPEKHQLRTLLRTANRIREEYAPDSGAGTPDRIAIVVALSLAALLLVLIVREQSAFASLAAARYAAETEHAIPTSTSIVAESMRVDTAIDLGGTLRSQVTAVIRNTGVRAEKHLSFALNPNVNVRSLRVGSGTWAGDPSTVLRRRDLPVESVADLGRLRRLRMTAVPGAFRMHRVWERLDIDLDPPLAPHQTQTLSFDLDGRPGEIDFALQSPGNFRARWNRYRLAEQSIFMSDLSRSTILPAANEVRMRLRASDIAPVLRYSAWTLMEDRDSDGFTPETIATNTALDLHLRHPYPIAADSCGVVASMGTIVSRCSVPLPSYLVFGGPMTPRAAGPATLVYIPAHELLAQTHTPSLASSIRLAAEAWPQLALPPHLVFVERPTEPDDRSWYSDFQPWRTVSQIGSSGSMFFVPELIFSTKKPLNANFFAASIIAGTLRGKRRVLPEESAFFTSFYTAVAIGRLGMRKSNAVEQGVGVAPETAPLLFGYNSAGSRMPKVLAAIEYRVGAGHFADGINDFVNRGGDRAGSAKELVDAIGNAGGIDLTHAYDDYFAGRAIPQLTLDHVTFHHAGQRWEVSGIVKNHGSGEAFVPVALRTSQGSLVQTIRVGSGGSTPFTFAASGEPHSVQLDPDGVCYRQAAIGLVENVEYRGEP